MLVLDISCQQLGGMNVSWLVSVCPSGAWLVNIYIQNISLCWIYAANNFVSICKLNIYVGVGYSSLGIIFGAVGGRVGKYTFFEIYIIGYIQFTIWGINVVMKYVMPTVGG